MESISVNMSVEPNSEFRPLELKLVAKSEPMRSENLGNIKKLSKTTKKDRNAMMVAM
jgi:hypothetical protein